MFELLFCPQHGVFRPENVAMLYTAGQSTFLYAQFYLDRYVWRLL